MLAEPEVPSHLPAASGGDQMSVAAFATAAWPEYPEPSKKNSCRVAASSKICYRTFEGETTRGKKRACLSYALVVTAASGLPTWARKRRAQWANVYAVFGRSPRSSM